MRTKNTSAYALAKVPDTQSPEHPTLVLDPTGALIADTNRARLEAKLELLQSVSPDFKEITVVSVVLKQVTA